MNRIDSLLAAMRRAGLPPDKYITVHEAAKRLGASMEIVRYRIDFLEGSKVGQRWVVLASKVELLRKIRAGEIEDPKPTLPERTSPPLPPKWTSDKSGIEITGRSWADWNTGEIWVPTEQAASILGVTILHVAKMARQGKLRRRWKSRKTGGEVVLPRGARPLGLCGMFCLTELDCLVNERSKKTPRPSSIWNDPECSTPPPMYREFDDIGPNDSLITVSEAAGILGIKRAAVLGHVRRGQFFAWQKDRGKHGSPVYLSLMQIARYRDDPRRQQMLEWQRAARERKLRGEDPPKRYSEFREDYDLTSDSGRSLKRNHGEYYSTRQAAQVLGVATQTVMKMRRRGTLEGHRRGHNAGKRFDLKRHWFFKKDDVHALKNNLDHQKRRAIYLRAKRRELFGDDIDTPRFTDSTMGPIRPIRPIEDQPPKTRRPRKRPEHIPQWVKDMERGPVTPGEDRYIPHDPRNVVFLKTEHERWLEETRAYLEELNTPDPRERGGEIPGRYFFPGHQNPE